MSPNIEIVLPITSICLTVFGNNEKLRYSVDKTVNGLDNQDIIDKGEKVSGGILDPKLGANHMGTDCLTCGETSGNPEGDCANHMGHLLLPRDVYDSGFEPYVKKTLMCICSNCSRIPIQSKTPAGAQLRNIVKNVPDTLRLDAIKNLVEKVKVCPFCNAQKPKIKKESRDPNAIRLYEEYAVKKDKDKEKEVEKTNAKPNIVYLTANDVYRKFQNMNDDTVRILGFDPSEYKLYDWIIRVFGVSATAIRPSVKPDHLAEGTAEDDLTKKTLDIVKQCNNIRSLMDNTTNEKSKTYIENHTKLLQYNVSIFRNNKNASKGMQKGNVKAMKSITERIQGKEGRIRHDIEGKRVDFCARSVISSDPNISIDQVSIPLQIAMTLTIPVIVSKNNIKELTKYVRNGRHKYPGANYVKLKNTNSSRKHLYKDLSMFNSNIKLHVGDIVERHLQNDDPVLMNRQPSLHKMSIMCHRALINLEKNISALRLNVNVTSPYNADFDGDEMNLYVVQSIQELVEIIMLAHVDKHILTPCYSAPIISFKQDTPAGIYKMTEKEVEIGWYDAMYMASYIEGFDVSKIKKKNITSYNLFSFIIPDMINYEKWSDGKKVIEIVNGELLYGKITGSILTQVLIMLIWDKYGPKTTRIFINNAQRLAEMYLYRVGMTVGYADTIPTPEIKEKSKKLIHETIFKASTMLTEIENNPKMLDPDTFEKYLFSVLATIKSKVASMTFKMLDSTNNFYVLIDSKAKGSEANIGNIMGGKAQEVLKYARITKTVNGRCLPHLCYNDDTALARGFIPNAYHEGMDPIDYWFYHQGGREGIINTAVTTAESGYQQRRLIKALESIIAMYDGTVRTSNGVVLQIIYGDSQFDQTMHKKVKLRTIEMNNEQIRKEHLFDKKDDFTKINKQFVDDLIDMRNKMRSYQLRSHLKYGTLHNEFFQAANYPRIINDVKNTNDSDNKPLSPHYIIEQIEKVLDHSKTALLLFKDKTMNPIKHNDELTFKFLFKYFLYEYLSPKQCIEYHKLNKTKFDKVILEIVLSFNKALIQAGETVGILAAQSMGEPLTQMTLSSFHKSGSGVAGLQGTPRLKELLGRIKLIATPIMFIYLLPQYREDKSMVNKIAAGLKFTNCKDIVTKTSTVFDPFNAQTEKDGMDDKSIFNVKMIDTIDLRSFPWLYKIHLDREKVVDLNINMSDIKVKFMNFWEEIDSKKTKYITKINNVAILTNYINSEEPMIHIRCNISSVADNVLEEFLNLILSNFYIKGDNKIKKIDEIAHDALIDYDDKTGDVKNTKEYVIYTSGINFNKIKNIPYVDQNRTICNDIRTMQTLYGIESARTVLLKEINGVFSDKINHSHIATVCDLMTHTGDITSIDRFGISKLGIGVLSKATFEKTMDILTHAAVYNRKDHLTNVSSSIMLGKPFKGGTGMCSVMMDNEILENSEFGNIDYDGIGKITMSRMNMIDDILYKQDNKELFIPQ